MKRQAGLRVTERDVQRGCIELLRYHGWIVRPAPRDGRKAIRGAYSIPPGEPDLLAVRWENGAWRVLLIECKAPGGRLAPHQKRWIESQPFSVLVVTDAKELERLAVL